MLYEEYVQKIDTICLEASEKIAFNWIDNKNQTKSLKYGELHNILLNFKQLVAQLHIKSGNKVCIISNNLMKNQLAFLCASYANLTSVLINPKLPNIQIKNMLEKMDISLFLSDKQTYEKINKIISCKVLDVENCYSPLNDLPILTIDSANETDEIAIIYSSGTSASAKPIILSYQGYLFSANALINIASKYKCLNIACVFPMHHFSGPENLLSAILSKTTVNTIEKFEMNKLVNLLTKFNPYIFGMAPIVIETLIHELEVNIKNRNKFIYSYYNFIKSLSFKLCKKLKYRKLSKLLLKPFYSKVFGKNIDAIVCSSSQITKFVVDSIMSYGLFLYNAYASTECGCPITCTTHNDFVFDDTVGKINSIPGVDVKLINTNDQGIGEVCLKTGAIMKGYYNETVNNRVYFTEDNYFMTGDLGQIINGYLYIKGRVKDIIKLRNGKKLSPIDLEGLLQPCLIDNNYVVCGIKQDSIEYDDIYLFIENRNYSNDQKQNIVKNVIKYNNKLNIYPIKDVVFINKIPKNSFGKIERYKLEKELDKNTVDSSELLKLFSKYTHINNNDLNTKLSDLGIDSLSMYSIGVDIKDKYDTDIFKFLSSNTTIQDLLDYIEGNDAYSKLRLRRIKSNEIKYMAKLAAECFYDYPLYKVFYPDDNSRKYFLFLNCWFTIYKRFKCSYVNEEKTLYIAFKKPGDKNRSCLGLFFNPEFTYKAFKTSKLISSLKLLQTYGSFSDKIKAKYYNPNEDNYIENMFVKKENQGDGLIFKALSYLDDGKKVYAETHADSNAKLFEKMGMRICEVAVWKDVKHYALIKNKPY